jgi:hypothetical protein
MDAIMLERSKRELDDTKNEGTHYNGENCAKKEKNVVWKTDTKKKKRSKNGKGSK